MELEGAIRKLNRIERDACLLLVPAAAGGFVVSRDAATVASILAGGALMVANFHLLWRFVRRAWERVGMERGVFLAGIFLLFFLFLGAVWGCLIVLKLPVIPFFVGTLCLVVSIFLHGLLLV